MEVEEEASKCLERSMDLKSSSLEMNSSLFRSISGGLAKMGIRVFLMIIEEESSYAHAPCFSILS